MVELQSCSSLVNASALCVIEQEVKGESVNVVAEISAELERERQKNSELMKRISMLEAQLRERNIETQESHHQHAGAASSKKFKRQRIEQATDEEEKNNNVKSEMASQYRPGIDPAKCLINEADSESVADFNETDSDDDCDDNYDDDRVSQRHEEIEGIIETVNEKKGYSASYVKQDDHENQKTNHSEKREVKSQEGTKIRETEFEVPSSGFIILKSQNKKPPKVAFSPKEVKRIIESEALLQKNAQSHTIRKIIVFSSLGIRHGCEDMYELDLKHFSILNKEEPYVSPTNPGEHVLYENPGVRKKIFYPNRENPVLCPVQIIEEENAMRPCDPSCPSFLFLCIKYGGRTRNLPQNEYVRQRMGRNKLKSFGPVMCRMGMLVHIRSGSFFFKALGITLLFMAGFPDDLVQRETKYHNLDLLHKYYRTDEDAEGEQLFLPIPIACDNGSKNPENLTGKTVAAKSKGRKNTSDIFKPYSSINAPSYHQQLAPTGSAQTQFAMAAFHSIPFPSQISQDTPHHMPNPTLATGNNNSYYMLPPQPASTIVPVMYWPPPNTYLHGHYPSTYGYQFLPCAASYMPFHTTQPNYNHPSCSSTLPKLLEGGGKNDLASEQCDSDTDSTEDHDASATASMTCHK
ncbi:hypothetical protein HN51_002787 [Arachis hypogaea]|uniref:Homer protein n=1 Tax=Arachis hypogaea TaxID=3818 RepID=A0A445EL68_ARAHY|nr:uncharacterized protein LOC112705722 [Arachis hypogaea]QHO51017.1 uncharacterized protein DS421_1g27280 [Arachis hypogaea]RYR76194.1 hypothetical protein Ahy_A01g000804 [Arachis hypogaea]